ncbi:HAUS augmin-like complex subunit 3 [Talpa occidentalis]|uniref:HAUS augmin-like complex subunit 3 n=1 Tax=Talpa occidentalis TaxID=50954 RepID=UPI00188F3BFF|nr:HAUS augmin-like complex subunit 3 [Talpa occidentalis]
MSGGSEFVETLRALRYPGAGRLCAADFDWLFEAAEDAAFLRWFCGRVGARSALSGAELRAFGALRAAGQPVLEGAALDAALRACGAPGPGARAVRAGELAALEEQARALQSLRSLKLQRRNRSQLLAAAAAPRAARLGAQEEAAAGTLRRGRAAAQAARAGVGRELRGVADAVARLGPLWRPADAGPRALFSQLSLERFLGQEERSTAALSAYAQRRLLPGARQAAGRGGGGESGRPPAPRAPDERRREMARLRLACVCAQHQLARLEAGARGLRARVEWAEATLAALAAQAAGEDALDTDVSSLSREVVSLEDELARVERARLPAVAKESARCLDVPVARGDADLQLAEQDASTATQEFVLSQLIKQKASFELLQLSFEVELRKHGDINRQLENLVQELSQSTAALRRRVDLLADAAGWRQASPRDAIEAKDYSAHRLSELLEGENKKKELFMTHGNLEKAAQKLKQAVSLAQNQLEISTREHSSFLSKLNNDVDMLCDALYQGGKQLLLSNQELTEQFHQVESQLNKLNHLFTDVLADVKTKRKMLESNKLLQMERKLYVYFLKDENYLKDIVENLENQSKIKTIGLEITKN